jgi:hypothetical protein
MSAGTETLIPKKGFKGKIKAAYRNMPLFVD